MLGVNARSFFHPSCSDCATVTFNVTVWSVFYFRVEQERDADYHDTDFVKSVQPTWQLPWGADHFLRTFLTPLLSARESQFASQFASQFSSARSLSTTNFVSPILQSTGTDSRVLFWLRHCVHDLPCDITDKRQSAVISLRNFSAGQSGKEDWHRLIPHNSQFFQYAFSWDADHDKFFACSANHALNFKSKWTSMTASDNEFVRLFRCSGKHITANQQRLQANTT